MLPHSHLQAREFPALNLDQAPSPPGGLLQLYSYALWSADTSAVSDPGHTLPSSTSINHAPPGSAHAPSWELHGALRVMFKTHALSWTRWSDPLQQQHTAPARAAAAARHRALRDSPPPGPQANGSLSRTFSPLYVLRTSCSS